MKFGQRLKRLREEKGISQLELSREINISNSTLSLYEANKREPDYDTLIKLADYFNVSTDWLLGRTDKKSFTPTPDTDITDAQIAANMEGRYGEKPSPELVAFIKRVINEELEKRKN